MKSVAFDLSTWHSGPTCVCQVVTKGVAQGIGVVLWCATCKVLCDVEATGQRISVAASFVPKGAA